MKIEDFNERLENSVLVADGAMGSMLFESAGAQRCFDELNAIAARSRLPRSSGLSSKPARKFIETNTFGANRIKLAAARPRRPRHRHQSSRRENRPRSPRSRPPRSADCRLDRPAGHRPASATFASRRNAIHLPRTSRARSKNAAWIFSSSKRSAIWMNCSQPSTRFARSRVCRSSRN